MIKNTEPWMQYAVCGSVGTEVFYPEPGEDWMPTATLCRTGCPVKAQCLDYAMRLEQGMERRYRYGIFGGMTPNGREKHESAWLAEQEAVA